MTESIQGYGKDQIENFVSYHVRKMKSRSKIRWVLLYKQTGQVLSKVSSLVIKEHKVTEMLLWVVNRLPLMLVFLYFSNIELKAIIGLVINPSGGAVASWLVRSSLDWAIRVQALAGDVVLCSWARHCYLTVPLSTQVYKFNAGGNPAMV